MRQFLSLRFWLSLAALAGLFLVLILVFNRTTPPTGVQASSDDEPVTHEIDLISWAFGITPETGFAFDDGRTTADLALQLDGTRTMVIEAGTPGEIDCPDLTAVATCTVAADLLGDAVLWFSIIEGPPGQTVQLPAVREMLDGPFVLLENDWVVRRAGKVDRSCPEDTSSLTDFINTYGAAATSTFNFETQMITKVTCPDPEAESSTTTSTSVLPATSVIVGTETEDVADTTSP